MCIIVNENNIVQSISLIPGGQLRIPETWYCYFPVDLPDGLKVGDYYENAGHKKKIADFEEKYSKNI